MRDRKHLIKAARKVPEQQIVDFLRSANVTVDNCFLLRDKNLNCTFIRRWHGMGEMTIDDDVIALACNLYMEANGYLAFDSTEDAAAYFQVKSRKA